MMSSNLIRNWSRMRCNPGFLLYPENAERNASTANKAVTRVPSVKSVNAHIIVTIASTRLTANAVILANVFILKLMLLRNRTILGSNHTSIPVLPLHGLYTDKHRCKDKLHMAGGLGLSAGLGMVPLPIIFILWNLDLSILWADLASEAVASPTSSCAGRYPDRSRVTCSRHSVRSPSGFQISCSSP